MEKCILEQNIDMYRSIGISSHPYLPGKQSLPYTQSKANHVHSLTNWIHCLTNITANTDLKVKNSVVNCYKIERLHTK